MANMALLKLDLTNRQQKITAANNNNATTSTPVNISCGVPQG